MTIYAIVFYVADGLLTNSKPGCYLIGGNATHEQELDFLYTRNC